MKLTFGCEVLIYYTNFIFSILTHFITKNIYMLESVFIFYQTEKSVDIALYKDYQKFL